MVFKKLLIYVWKPWINLLPGKRKIQEVATQPAITCSKLKIETLEQDVKYIQS